VSVCATLTACPRAPETSSDTEREVDGLGDELPSTGETEVVDPDTDVTEATEVTEVTEAELPATCPGGCDDGNPCTDGFCETGVCRYVPNVLRCNDGDACTGLDRCVGGACVGNPLACDDDNACTDDSCEDGVCGFQPASCGCDDGDVCTVSDLCIDGACVGQPRTCPVSACATVTCEPRTGCALVPFEGPCDDGNACTSDDTCRAATCAGSIVRCDDDNPCTDDYCDPASGCIHRDNAAACDDADACTGPDRCRLGACTPGANVCCGADTDCPSTDACTITRCVDGGCVAEPTCGDDDACTLDRCTAGACTFPAWSTLVTVVDGLALVDDFEAGASVWTFESDNPLVGWATTTTWAAGGNTSLYLGNPETLTYDHGPVRAVATRELLVPPGQFTLTMAVRSDFDDDGSCLYDALTVTLVPLSPRGEPTTLGQVCASGQGVRRFALDVSTGSAWRLELVFDTVDELRNDGAGVWIDDVHLEGAAPACP